MQEELSDQMGRLKQAHAAKSSQMAEQCDEALRATSAKENLLAEAVDQKNQLNAAHVQWALEIAANFSELQAESKIFEDSMCRD